MEGHRLVFVCGLHRSGTSLLARAIAENSLVSAFANTGVPEDEGQHLQSVYPPGKVYGGPGRFGFARAAHLTERSRLVTESNRQRLFSEWATYWDLSKLVLLEKSPPNLIRTRFLQAMFPGASFVVVTRHPVPVAYATQKWRRGMTIGALIRHWLVCHELFERDRDRIERLQVLRYEDFVREPAQTVADICAFLGIESHEPSLDVRPDGNEPYLARWRESRRRVTTGAYLRLLDLRFERRVRAFGYSLRDPARK